MRRRTAVSPDTPREGDSNGWSEEGEPVSSGTCHYEHGEIRAGFGGRCKINPIDLVDFVPFIVP